MSISVFDRSPDIPETDGFDSDLREVQIVQTGAAGDSTPIVEDGVIFDARRHARRRRTGYAVIVAAAALAMVGSAFAVLVGSSDDPPGTTGPDQPGPFAAPVNRADVVGIWAQLHSGWVYVYDDGRVLSLPDAGPITERHLSPYGVALVREGGLDPKLLLHPQFTSLPAEVWSDPAPRPYSPSEYALCNLRLVPDPTPDILSDVGLIDGRLSEQVRALLRTGHVQSFTDDFLDEKGNFIGPDGYHSAPGRGVDCFVMGVQETQAIWAHTRAQTGAPEGDNAFRRSDTTFGTLTGTDGSEFVVLAIPIMPHGGWVLWGG